MTSQKGLWLILVLLVSTSLFGENIPKWKTQPEKVAENSLSSSDFFCNDDVLKTNLFSSVDLAHNHKAIQLLKVFDLGELSLSTPYLPFLNQSEDLRSEASINLNLPEEWGGVQVHGGVSYQAENQVSNKTSSPQEHVFYFVSTKNISDSSWKPFLSVSYVRSQVRDLSKAKRLKIAQDNNSFASQVRYSNAEVLGTCCGVQPIENLSMILSYNYLKPLNRGNYVTHHNVKDFDQLRTKNHTNGVDFKLDYAVKKGLNVLVKSECLLPNGTFKDTDAPVLIEGQLIVSF